MSMFYADGSRGPSAAFWFGLLDFWDGFGNWVVLVQITKRFCSRKIFGNRSFNFFLEIKRTAGSKEPILTKNSPGLYPWSKDLEASCDVRLRERKSFAMLFGWLEKFVTGQGLAPGRSACERERAGQNKAAREVAARSMGSPASPGYAEAGSG
jgi:hypothetical protein